ncbi:hypothetical protein MKX50_20610 [Paenibacillus sp. FSL W8-0186]|uniref:hypothetical protein n=1 Tax=Paenibacillus sp. FSL W8-0186 TaxID=2921709 RepID=UPI0030CF0D3E
MMSRNRRVQSVRVRKQRYCPFVSPHFRQLSVTTVILCAFVAIALCSSLKLGKEAMGSTESHPPSTAAIRN